MAEKRKAPVEGQVYRHFKGTLYKVVAVAVHTETEEKLVVYQSVENPGRVFARPLEMFMSDVDRFRYPLIRAKYRFTLVEDVCEKNAECSTVEAGGEEPAEEVIIENAGEDAIDENAAEEKDHVEELHEDINEDIKEEPACEKAPECVSDSTEDDTAKYKADGELVLDPYVEAVLDEKEYSDKIENFEFLRGKCTEDMLTTIAISLDIQLVEGTLEEKYAQILKTLRMHEKYESSRLRP